MATSKTKKSVKKATAKKRATKKRALALNARVQRINVPMKALVQTEPPLDSDPSHLAAGFRGRLETALGQLAAAGTLFRLAEGYRTLNRQQYLYGSGRPAAVPYGRSGPILTNADGVTNPSKHQGNGTVGSGLAADCYPTGLPNIPPASDPIWEAYASAVEQQGLTAGLRFTNVDAPHCEMP